MIKRIILFCAFGICSSLMVVAHNPVERDSTTQNNPISEEVVKTRKFKGLDNLITADLPQNNYGGNEFDQDFLTKNYLLAKETDPQILKAKAVFETLEATITNLRANVSYLFKKKHNFHLNAIQLFKNLATGSTHDLTITFGHSYSF